MKGNYVLYANGTIEDVQTNNIYYVEDLYGKRLVGIDLDEEADGQIVIEVEE